MSDKLEYVLMPQLVERTEIQCIGVAFGTRDDSSSTVHSSIAAAKDDMETMVREMGGTVVIDPQIKVLSSERFRHSIIVDCKVGVINGEPQAPQSE